MDISTLYTEEDLKAVKAAKMALITGGAVMGYTVAGRSVQHYTFDDLTKLEVQIISCLITRESSFVKAVLSLP